MRHSAGKKPHSRQFLGLDKFFLILFNLPEVPRCHYITQYSPLIIRDRVNIEEHRYFFSVRSKKSAFSVPQNGAPEQITVFCSSGKKPVYTLSFHIAIFIARDIQKCPVSGNYIFFGIEKHKGIRHGKQDIFRRHIRVY